MLGWANNKKSGKAELRTVGEGNLYAVREPWRFALNVGAVFPEKIEDVEPSTELVRFDENSLMKKVQSMTEQNKKELREEIEVAGKSNIEKMEGMLQTAINPIQQQLTQVGEGTKSGMRGMQKKMQKAEKKAKKNAKSNKKRNTRNEQMLATLLRAQGLQVPEAASDSSESSEDSDSEQDAKPIETAGAAEPDGKEVFASMKGAAKRPDAGDDAPKGNKRHCSEVAEKRDSEGDVGRNEKEVDAELQLKALRRRAPRSSDS
eukprot:g10146.t1